MLQALLLAAASLVLPAPSQDGDDPHRQFDFWVGEWSVQNRRIQPDGSWRDGDVTRARIVPVCGGKAILEEWAGPFHGTFMNGFSLRAYDPARADWDLLLFWTTDGNADFGNLRGTFRHGRGEFFSGNDPNWQRYSFSDGLPDSVRWDSAVTSDARRTWKTDWIMEFSRTRAAREVTQEELFRVAWTKGGVSPHVEARRLDWMLGSWSGTQTVAAADGVEQARDARLRCKLLDKDCLVLDLLEARAPDVADWEERLSVRGYIAGSGQWKSYRMSEEDTVLRGAYGKPAQDLAVFEGRDAGGGTYRETLHHTGELFVIEEERRPSGATEFDLIRRTVLRRDK